MQIMNLKLLINDVLNILSLILKFLTNQKSQAGVDEPLELSTVIQQ